MKPGEKYGGFIPWDNVNAEVYGPPKDDGPIAGGTVILPACEPAPEEPEEEKEEEQEKEEAEDEK